MQIDKERRFREAQLPRVDMKEDWKTVDAGIIFTDNDTGMTVDQKINEDIGKVEMITHRRRA